MCVLLVEDDLLIRELMSESLQDAGYEVLEAEDGAAAMVAIRDPPRRLCILVTDFHMPGALDGSQVAAEARKVMPDLPVVIATGRPDVLQAQWRLELGYCLLKKPYLPSQLVALVQALTSGAQA